MGNEQFTAHDVLLALAALDKGDWDAMYADIKRRREITFDDFVPESELLGWTALTPVDEGYPEGQLKNTPRPPLVLFTKGDPAILKAHRPMAIIPSPREEVGDHPAIDSLIAELPSAGIPAVILWRELDGKENGHARFAMKVYRGSGVPFAVVLPKSAKDRDAIVYEVVSGGGLAITEALPWYDASRSPDPYAGRIAAGMARSALVLGGHDHGPGAIDAAYALNAGLDIGCVSREIGDPNGALCVELMRDGAAVVGSIDDVAWLRNGDEPAGGKA